MVTFKQPDVEQFFRVYGIQNFSVSPDETQVVYSTNLTGKYNLWSLDPSNPYPTPLTFIDQSCHALSFAKTGEFLVTAFDQDGDEDAQLYAMQLSGGELSELRVVKGHRHMNPILSKDAKRLYYTGSKDDSTFLKAYRYDLETGSEEIIWNGKEGSTYLARVSPEEKSFVVSTHFANTYVTAAIVVDGEEISLTPPTETQFVVDDVVYVSEDELYVLTNFEDDFSYLAKFSLETREFTKVFAVEKAEFGSVQFNKNQGLLYILASKGVQDYLYTFNPVTGESSSIALPCDIVSQFTVTESGNLYVLGAKATRPVNLYVKKSGEEFSQLTKHGVPGVDSNLLTEPEVLTYPSFDGKEIEALFFKAAPETSNGHVILWPHGGPQSAERKQFRALFQFLVHRGYSIFAPNFRGSTGYGLAFTKLVEGDWGHGPRLDNIAGLEYLYENGLADREKTLLMGGSFGGYMALLLHGRHAEYFKAIVDIFGPCNLFSFIDSVPDHWKPAMKQWVGDPIEDKDRLTADSPITYLETMTKPMLVIQGANDPRVVKAESDQIVAALTSKGFAVEYLVLDDEGHGFSKKENEMRVYRTVLEFFDRFI